MFTIIWLRPMMRNTVANKRTPSLQIVGDDNISEQTGVLYRWCGVRQIVSILDIGQDDDPGAIASVSSPSESRLRSTRRLL